MHRSTHGGMRAEPLEAALRRIVRLGCTSIGAEAVRLGAMQA
jgi:hypothetical protein